MWGLLWHVWDTGPEVRLAPAESLVPTRILFLAWCISLIEVLRCLWGPKSIDHGSMVSWKSFSCIWYRVKMKTMKTSESSTAIFYLGLPWWLSGKESACQRRGCRFSPWVEKIPWRRKWQPALVLSPGKSCGQTDLDMT